jgi:sec-independent protein translocase protein TatB
VRDEVERELRTEDLRQMITDQQEQIRSLKEIVNETRSEVESESDYLVKSLDEDIRELVEPKDRQSSDADQDSRDDERSTEGR